LDLEQRRSSAEDGGGADVGQRSPRAAVWK
jgi:hypothetical protein